MKTLNPYLESTWRQYESFFNQALAKKEFAEGLELLKILEPNAVDFIVGTSYCFYAVVFYAQVADFDQVYKIVQQAYNGGYESFWMFDPSSHGWGANPEADSNNEKYILLKPFYANEKCMSYVRGHHTGNVTPWGFELSWTPFCALEKVELTRKNEKCLITDKKLEKGSEVYSVRYFNGSYDVPSGAFYAGVAAADSSPVFTSNKNKYLNNNYELKDFNFKVYYRSQPINQFWKNLDSFDLSKTLQMIAHPRVDPTPYDLVRHAEDIIVGQQDVCVRAGQGAEYLELLWVLIKCGFLPQILTQLDQLPMHFKIALLLFDNTYVHNEILTKLNLPGVKSVFGIIFQEKLSEENIADLVKWGDNHPQFQKDLISCLQIYEPHLYSNYHPGLNWYYAEFSWLTLARGGRLLYLIASKYAALSVLQQMKETKSIPLGVSVGGWDAYSNSGPFFYQSLLLGLAVRKEPELSDWVSQDIFEDGRLSKAHKQVLKIIAKFFT